MSQLVDPAGWWALISSGWSDMGHTEALMTLPYLKIVGGLALFYIAAKLLVPDEPDENESEAAEHLWRAVRIVAIADIIMSLDNVIAIAAAAGGNMALLV